MGWPTNTQRELADHQRATLSSSAQPERIYEHYSIPAYNSGIEPAIDHGASIKSNENIVPECAVLLSKLNPEKDKVWAPNPNGEAAQVASMDFLLLTPLAPARRNVFYCLFRSPSFKAEMAAMVTGTSKFHQRVLPKSLALFDGTVSSMMSRLLSNRRESCELAKIRDLLLPKLMSGEMRLPNAERAVTAVAS